MFSSIFVSSIVLLFHKLSNYLNVSVPWVTQCDSPTFFFFRFCPWRRHIRRWRFLCCNLSWRNDSVHYALLNVSRYSVGPVKRMETSGDEENSLLIYTESEEQEGERWGARFLFYFWFEQGIRIPTLTFHIQSGRKLKDSPIQQVKFINLVFSLLTWPVFSLLTWPNWI